MGGGIETCDDPFEMVTDEVPDGLRVELLRSLSDPALKQGRDSHERRPRFLEMGMQSRERDRRLSGMLGPARHRGHQPRSAGDVLVSQFRCRHSGCISESLGIASPAAEKQGLGGWAEGTPLGFERKHGCTCLSTCSGRPEAPYHRPRPDPGPHAADIEATLMNGIRSLLCCVSLLPALACAGNWRVDAEGIGDLLRHARIAEFGIAPLLLTMAAMRCAEGLYSPSLRRQAEEGKFRRDLRSTSALWSLNNVVGRIIAERFAIRYRLTRSVVSPRTK